MKGNGPGGSLGKVKGFIIREIEQMELSPRDWHGLEDIDTRRENDGERGIAGLVGKSVCLSNGGCFEGRAHGSAIDYAVKPQQVQTPGLACRVVVRWLPSCVLVACFPGNHPSPSIASRRMDCPSLIFILGRVYAQETRTDIQSPYLR